MNENNTALILIGFQNDYFNKNGVLSSVLEDEVRTQDVLNKTVKLIDDIKHTDVTIVSTPIIFSSDYSEISQGDGILTAIKQAGAFKANTLGAKTVEEFNKFSDRLITIPGKRGFNAFVKTDLDTLLSDKGIKNVIFAGAITSICIDSTARAAYEYGYRVFILEDCTASRTNAEQDFFSGVIFPTYATVTDSKTVVKTFS